MATTEKMLHEEVKAAEGIVRVFEEAGIENPPKTWEELVDMAALLTKDTNDDGRIDQWGLRVRSNDDGLPYTILSMILQQNGTFMRDGRTCNSA